jgi:tRNA A-37 threonylcarbamoyl transferase component Bud32
VFYHNLLLYIRQILTENYKIKKISIKPIKAGISRLSNPIEITGISKRGKKTHYFGKIIGNSDVFTYRSIQYLKNVYLQLNGRPPLFGVFETPEEMAKGQYQILKTIQKSGIPTAKPYGVYRLRGSIWLLITEFLTGKPLSSVEKLDLKQMDTIFSYLKKMHKKKIYHGDLKPDNILINRKIYILDVGYVRKDTPKDEKQAYDLACLLCSFLRYQPAEQIVRIAKKYYSLKKLQTAMQYLEFVQMRPDIHFTDEMKTQLIFNLRKSAKKVRKK